MLPSFHRERKAREWSSSLLVRQIVSLLLSLNHPVLFFLILEEWLGQGNERSVVLAHAAAIGYEQIYREIFNWFHMKV